MRDLLAFKNIIVEFNLLEISLLGALVFCFLIQLYFVLFVHLKLASNINKTELEPANMPISVIIVARNQADYLRKYLQTVLDQQYSTFEVIVVNDRSWDGTSDLLEELELKYNHLKTVTVADGNKFIAGKKFALTMGIKAATYEWMVFTDADCEPVSRNWLSGMQQPIDDHQQLILGYSPLFKKPGLLNFFVRLEAFFSAVNYLSYALKGKPYAGSGKNMAYKKSLFFKNKGFASHMHITAGDDDLFVNANAKKHNTLVVIGKDAQVWSEPKTSWIAYLRDKKIKNEAHKLYQTKHKTILNTQALFRFLFYGFLIASLCFQATLYYALGILALNMLLRCLVYPRLLKRLNYGGLSWWFPLLDIIFLLFLVFNSFLSIFVKKVQWK